jgi:hypothetical protein
MAIRATIDGVTTRSGWPQAVAQLVRDIDRIRQLQSWNVIVVLTRSATLDPIRVVSPKANSLPFFPNHANAVPQLPAPRIAILSIFISA